MNTKIKRLTKSEKAIAVAKEVISLLKKGKIVAVSNSFLDVFVNTPIIYDSYDETQSVKKYLDGIINVQDNKCEVCAVGSMFVGYVNKFNQLNLDEIGMSLALEFEEAGEKYRTDNSYGFNFEEMSPTLEKCFNYKNINMIEIAYERGNGYFKESLNAGLSENVFLKCVAFGMRFEEKQDRMIAIMKNIIKNKGKFKP